MYEHLKTGRNGEGIAVQLLSERGYRIVCLNWRYKHLEIDIVAEDGDQLVFVEVKTRSDSRFGMPYEAVDWVKQGRLARAADRYIAAHRYQGEVRFDIVSVVYSQSDNAYEAQLIKDAFWPE